MIRVAHFMERAFSGGVEQMRLILAHRLPRDRFEQTFICTSAHPSMRAAFAEAGYTLHEVGDFRFPLDPSPHLRAVAILRRLHPNIAHGAVMEGISLAAIAGTIAQVPVIIAEETSDPDNQPRSRKGTLLYKAFLSRCAKVVAVSPATGHYLTETIHVPEDKVITIVNGVEHRPSSSLQDVRALRRSLGAAEGTSLLGCVGRIVDGHKRFSDSLRALKIMRDRGTDARLIIVGDGPDLSFLKGLARDLDIEEHVVFVGYVAAPLRYFEVIDILLHPAATEAFGLVLVEAMLARTAVIASNVGGIPSVLNHGAAGVLVEPFAPYKLAEAAIRLIKQVPARTHLIEVAYQWAKQKYSAEGYVSRIEDLYESLTNTTREER